MNAALQNIKNDHHDDNKRVADNDWTYPIILHDIIYVIGISV